MHRPLIPLVALLAACAPQNAVIDQGDFTVWLAATNSLTVARGDALFDDAGAPLLDVAGDKDASEGGYAFYKAIDCREFADVGPKEQENLRLPNREKICPDDPGADTIDQEVWLLQNGFHVVGDALDPWRGEAIITSEGDLQLAFHHRLPNGEDFRFEFVVDPDFQPQECVADATGGGSHLEDVDGDWVGEWSKDLPDGSKRYYLNSSAYQFDPEEPEPGNERARWFLPLTWRAGYAAGKFGDDRFSIRSTRYAEPESYIAADAAGSEIVSIDQDALFFCDLEEGQSGTESGCMDRLATRVDAVATDVLDELLTAGVPNQQGVPSPKPIVEDNSWRAGDGRDAGLDGWDGLDYSWVTFEPGSVLDVGGAVSGEFNLFFDAIDSTSRFYIRGHFTVDDVKKDHWTTDYLPEEDILPDTQPACGGSAADAE